MPIRALDPQVIARIAAGEVVERPASVVKELVENALDAHASQIAIDVGGGGVSLIRVADNGVGIPAHEVELAFKRHTTSKIANLDDLESICSLGFRGEALHSIAAVSQVELFTCALGETTGSAIMVKEGIVGHYISQARTQGTTIAVRNLFRNVPARLKFLKSPATETAHVANVITQYALAYAEVKFTLTVDGRTTLRTPGSGRLIDAVVEVYGTDIARHLLVINDEDEWTDKAGPAPILVQGMVSSSVVSRANRDYLSFCVNRRWVSNRVLGWAVEESYHGLLLTGKHPIAVINISLPPRELDVNIHPAKSEVKFRDEHLVFAAIQKAVRRTLLAQTPVPRIEEVATAYNMPPKTSPRLLWPPSQPRTEQHPSTSPSFRQSTPATTPAFSLPALRVLGQLSRTYVIAEGPDGLYLIDQHAAHERVLFERVKQQASHQKLEVQGLLEPATLEVSPSQDAVMKSHLEKLTEFGFAIEPFGERTYLVRTIPAVLNQQDWRGALTELLDSSREQANQDWMERIMATIACHSAVRAGKVLTDDEMRELIRQLEHTVLPHSCPHGRPTMVHLTLAQLGKEFERT